MAMHGYEVGERRLPWLVKALIFLLLLSQSQNFLLIQKSVAAEQEWATSKLTIAPGGISSAKFSAKKDAPMFISIQGAQRTSASGFTGSCYFFRSDSKNAYAEAGYGSLQFKDEAVTFQNFKPSYSGEYSIECKNESASESAVVELSFFSIINISSQNQGILKVPALNVRILKFSVQKDTLGFVSIKGSPRSTPSGFQGSCELYRGNGDLAYAETSYNSYRFRDEYISYQKLKPTYTGDYYLICANNSNEAAELSFALFNTSSVVSSSNLLVNIPGNGIKVLRFNGQKDEILTVTATGGARTTPSGFLGKCVPYRGNGDTAFEETSYSYVNFKDQTTNSLKFKATYSGAYFLVCSNDSAESAKIQFGGISSLNEVTSSNSFFGYSVQSTQNGKPTPSPSATATNPQSGSGQSPGTSSGSGSGINSQVQTSIDQATRLASVANDASTNLNTNTFNEKAYKDALDTINKAIASANNAVEKAKDAAKNAKDSAKDAADSQVKAAEKALEAAKSAKQAANDAKSINSTISGIQDALKNTKISQPKSSSKLCESIVAGVAGSLGIAGAVATKGKATDVMAALAATVTSVVGAIIC